MRRLTTVLLVAGMTAISAAAQATITITQGVTGGSGDVDNILFNDDSLTLLGNPVTGLTQSGALVTISSDEVLMVNAQGQATVNAIDGSFDDIMIELTDPFALKVQFQVNIFGTGTIGDIKITMYDDQFGEFFESFFDIGPGNTFFTGIATDNQLITKIIVEGLGSTRSEIFALQQIRVGEAEAGASSGGSNGGSSGGSNGGTPVPAPGALGLFGLAMLGLGLYRRQRLAA